MKINQIKFSGLFLFVAWLMLMVPIHARAVDNSEIIVTPSIIDEQAEIRDILEYGIKIKNTGTVKAELYPFVNDLKKKEGEQPFDNPAELDKTVSLARWIEVSRAVVELIPGEEKTVPLKININPAAKAGMYFAAVTFGRGSNRDAAEQNRQATNQPKVLLNIEVKEHIVEKAEGGLFSAERNININHRVNFLFSVKNIGNRAIKPKGSIIIYNRRGAEVAALAVNQEQAAIEPQASMPFKLAWAGGKASGQYKAILKLEYGDSRKDINDTIYFWFLPWELLVLSLVLLLAVMISFWLLSRHNRRQHQQLAARQVITKYEAPRLPTVIDLKNKK